MAPAVRIGKFHKGGRIWIPGYKTTGARHRVGTELSAGERRRE